MNYEEVLKKAEGKEIEARDYYTSLAKMCVNDYSKQTLLFLADQEEKHRQLIKNFIDTDEAERKSIVLPEAEDVCVHARPIAIVKPATVPRKVGGLVQESQRGVVKVRGFRLA